MEVLFGFSDLSINSLIIKKEFNIKIIPNNEIIPGILRHTQLKFPFGDNFIHNNIKNRRKENKEINSQIFII